MPDIHEELTDTCLKASARATVTVTLEILVDSLWGDQTTVNQVHKQALGGAEAILSNLIQKEKGRLRVLSPIRVVNVVTTLGEK